MFIDLLHFFYELLMSIFCPFEKVRMVLSLSTSSVHNSDVNPLYLLSVLQFSLICLLTLFIGCFATQKNKIFICSDFLDFLNGFWVYLLGKNSLSWAYINVLQKFFQYFHVFLPLDFWFIWNIFVNSMEGVCVGGEGVKLLSYWVTNCGSTNFIKETLLAVW